MSDDDFFEEDEPLEKIQDQFARGEPFVTGPVAAEIDAFLDDPSSGVRRERPTRG